MLRHLALALSVTAFAVVASACCEWSNTCGIPPATDAGPPPAPDCVGIACAVSTAGCDAATIRSDVNGGVCATCVSAQGPVDICGAPDDARCESRENAAGHTCVLCATAAGEILYDSCFKSDPVPFASCERSPGTPDSVCKTCTDNQGVVVSTSCEPVSDECHDENGCRVCTANGQVVVTDCAQQPNIQPRSCQAYDNDAGRCVDCFGDHDELLTHSCTLSSDPFVACAQSATQDGLVCTTCTDAGGAVVSSKCASQQPTPSQCQQLDYTEQSCVVCVDATNSPASWQCASTDPSTVPNGVPPDCFFENGVDGSLCRTCPVGNNGATEQRCLVDTHLVCSDGQGTDPSLGGCFSCSDKDSGVEVYRRCDGTGAAPVCSAAASPDGSPCEVCADPATKQPFYAACSAQTCFALGAFQVSGAQGTSLFVDTAPAVATCTTCGSGANGVVAASDFNALCTLRNDCGAVDLTNPSASCSNTVVFTAQPRACANPWEPGYASQVPGGSDEIVHILAFALEQRGVALVAIDDVGHANPPAATCADARGDTLQIVARPEDAVAVSDLFGPVLLRCSADADCATGGACRVDGSCTAP